MLESIIEGNMTICSTEAGNIARGRSPMEILPVEGEQHHTRATIVLLYRKKQFFRFAMPWLSIKMKESATLLSRSTHSQKMNDVTRG